MNRSKFVSVLALTSIILLASSSQGADYAKKEELYIEYKEPAQITIASDGINRISLYPFIATTIWGDSAEYSALLSHNGSELFLTSKLEAGKSFALAVQLAGGRVIDLVFNTIECDRPKIVHLDLQDKSTASSERVSEIKQLIKAMISKEKGKYYVVESRKKVKLNNEHNASSEQNIPLTSLVAEQTSLYRYGDLVGIILTLQNKSKKDVLIETKSLSKTFKGVLAVSLHNQLLKRGSSMEAFFSVKEGVRIMIEQLKEMLGATFGRGEGDNNKAISARQKLILKLVIGTIMLIGFGLVILVQEKNKTYAKKNELIEEKINKIELPDTTIDTEKRWREHFEKIMADQKEEINERLKNMESAQDQLVSKASSTIEQELRETKEKLKMAQEELTNASLDLRRVAGEEQERLNAIPTHQNAMSVQEFEHEVEFDRPKSAANYIPEGTYFTGYLLGGIVVSTALSAPDENATPVSIRLTSRGNLNKANKTDMAKCSIMGSAYGDLSSERAIIRLEKLVCEHDGLYVTSKIAGQIFGPDGYNGIKGTVVSTGSKHIKNAVVGGLISGLSGSAKGQEGGVISGSGIISTKKKGMGDMLTQGALTGTSNAGEKIADYYLRQAEAMSPVLTIPSGVRVNAQITRGFFVGEVNTHQKIKQAKQ